MANFNGVMEVVTALLSHRVQRLKDAWKHVSSRAMARYQKLEDLISPLHNSSRYRTELAKSLGVTSPVVPVVGIHLGDLVHILEGHTTDVDGYYELQQILRMGETMTMLKKVKLQACIVDEDASVSHFFANLASYYPAPMDD